MKSFYDFPDYDVTKSGRVISYRRNSKGMELKASLNNRGYLCVTLYNNDGKTGFLVHRLVAEVFIRNPKKGEQINHKNGIKTDNRVSNLEWLTCKENIRHAYKTGIVDTSKKSFKGATNGNSKLTKKDVLQIRSLYKNPNISTREISESYSISLNYVYNIVKKRNWNHI